MRALTKIGPVLAVALYVTALRADDSKPAKPVSAAEMQAGAVRIDAECKADYREMLQLQAQARKQKDVIKLNCVNSRLVEVKAHMNLIDSTNQQLQLALQKNSDERNTLYASMVASQQSIATLRDEARGCVGEPEMFKQEAGGVEVQRPDLPDDPTIGNPFVNEIEPPAYASPFF